MQLTFVKTVDLIASAAAIIPLALTALALVLVSIASLAMSDARRQHALLVLDRLAVFAFALRGTPRTVRAVAPRPGQPMGRHHDQARAGLRALAGAPSGDDSNTGWSSACRHGGCVNVPTGVIATGSLAGGRVQHSDRLCKGELACATPTATSQQQAGQGAPGGRGSATRSCWLAARRVVGLNASRPRRSPRYLAG